MCSSNKEIFVCFDPGCFNLRAKYEILLAIVTHSSQHIDRSCERDLNWGPSAKARVPNYTFTKVPNYAFTKVPNYAFR